MKVVSKKKLVYNADRDGIKEEFIQIDLIILKRDDVSKKITLQATDSIILNKGLTYNNIEDDRDYQLESYLRINTKTYEKTYKEYDTQRAYLLSQDNSGLTGLELEDKLLQDALLYSLEVDPIYGATGSDWDRA